MSDDVDAQLRTQLEELREAVLLDWVQVTRHHAGAIRDMQESLSWRITRPLRLVRTYQYKVREVGALNATRIAAEIVVARVGARR